MSEWAIQARGLGKRYWIGKSQRADSLRDTLAAAVTGPLRRAVSLARGRGSSAETGADELWAMRGVDLDVARGETLGIVGRNGAGKSTLLKVLSRITEPTEGYADLAGRVASLLEVGTGFHPDLTGRENIFLNGSILGMTRREVKSQFGAIVDFAGVEKFLDTAVKHYSSGMYARLAFAVAAHLQSEILIVDEVLAVGDVEFQRRCLDRMGTAASGGRTVLFVSHNLAAVESLCQSCIYMEHGRVVSHGTPATAIQQYLGGEAAGDGRIDTEAQRKGDGRVRFTEVRLRDLEGAGLRSVPMGQPFSIQLLFARRHGRLRSPRFVIVVSSAMGQKLTRLSTQEAGFVPPDIGGNGSVAVEVSQLNLLPGRYYLTVHVQDQDGVVDRVEHACALDVSESDVYGSGKIPPADRGFLTFCHGRWSSDYAETAVYEN